MLHVVIMPCLGNQAGKKPKKHSTLECLKTWLYNMLESLQGTAVRRDRSTCGEMQGLHFIKLFQS